MVKSILSITLIVSASFVNAIELRVIEDPTSGLIKRVEFVDKSGDITKTIKRGTSHGKVVNRAKFSLSEIATSKRLLLAETTILPAKNHVLVYVEQARQVGDLEYEKAGLPFDVRNNVTVYDRNGNSVSTVLNLPCKPLAISDTGEIFLCYYEPVYNPDGRKISEHVNEELKNWGLYIYQFEMNQWKGSRFIGEGGYYFAKLSPNGQWLALPSVKSQPTHIDLLKIYSLKLPNGAPPVTTFEGRKFKRFTRLGNDGEVMIDEINIIFNQNGKPVREISNTEVIYRPETK